MLTFTGLNMKEIELNRLNLMNQQEMLYAEKMLLKGVNKDIRAGF